MQVKGAHVYRAVSADIATGVEGQAAVGGGDGFIDMDVVVGVQAEGVVGVPAHCAVDVHITGFGAAVDSRQGDIAVFQIGAESGSTNAAVGLRVTAVGNVKIGRVDQPFAGAAVVGFGGDLGAASDFDVGAGGVDKTAVAAVRR